MFELVCVWNELIAQEFISKKERNL